MHSLNILCENLDRISQRNGLNGYKELADYIGIKESTLRCWKSMLRCPSLKQIDNICDNMNLQSYVLIKPNSDLLVEAEFQKNNSRLKMLDYLQRYFLKYGRFTWNDKAALFYGFVSEDALKSYFRTINYKTPPLNKLDEMAEALGVPAYELIKGEIQDEKTN